MAKKKSAKPIQNTKRANAVRKAKGCYKARTATNQMLPGEILDREAFCERFGTTRQTVESWIDMGLKLRPLGKRRFIVQDDFREFLMSLEPIVPNRYKAAITEADQSPIRNPEQ